jgi:hypothetical protein
MTLSLTSFSITTLSIMTLNIMGLVTTLSTNDSQHELEFHYAECHDFLNVMLSVVMLNVIRLNVIILHVIAPYSTILIYNF